MQKISVTKPVKIAITGKIGSGKSTISEILIKLGYKVFESDKEVSLLFDNNSITKKIITIFSKKIKNLVNSKGKINRIALGNFVFSNKSELTKLEKIIHPLLSKKKQEFIQLESKEKILFFDIPLLFEKKLFKEFHFIIYLYIDKKNQFKRVLKRKGMTKDKFEEIYKFQDHDLKRNSKFISLRLDTSKSKKEVKKNLISFIISLGWNEKLS